MHGMLLQTNAQMGASQVHLKAALITVQKRKKGFLVMCENERDRKSEKGQRLTRHFQVSNEVAN